MTRDPTECALHMNCGLAWALYVAIVVGYVQLKYFQVVELALAVLGVLCLKKLELRLVKNETPEAENLFFVVF